MRRKRLKSLVGEGGSYFAGPKSELSFTSTGSKVLDLALGGGWAEQRIFNIVGDKSSGKTLLSIEACANFAIKYPKGIIRYREAEAAFDKSYAQALGMPIDKVDFGADDSPMDTVEDLFEDLEYTIERSKKKKVPCLYILDSLDALSDRAELERDMDEGTYGTNKARNMSQLLRRLTRQMASARLTLGIVSQVRSNIGVAFGPSTRRSGGRALDFYASQVLHLHHLGQVPRTIRGIKRAVGIEVRGRVDKNKVSLPYRDAYFKIMFGFGVDDISSCLQWLSSVNELGQVGITKKHIKRYVRSLMKKPGSEYDREVAKIHSIVSDKWYEIEREFLPTRSKYGGRS